jgi:hypothetical protein
MPSYGQALADITEISPSTTQANEFLARIASHVNGIYYTSFIHDLNQSRYIFTRLQAVIGAGLLDVNPQFNSGNGVAYEPATTGAGPSGAMAISENYFVGSSWERFFTILDHEAGHAETTVYFQNQSISHLNSVDVSIINGFISNPASLNQFVNDGIGYEVINEAYTIARSWNDWLANYKLNHDGTYYYGGDYNSSSFLFQEALKHFDGLTMVTDGSMNFIDGMSVGSDGMITLPTDYADAGSNATLKAIANRVKVKQGSVTHNAYGVDQGGPIIGHILAMKAYLGISGSLKFDFLSYGFVDKNGNELSSSEIVGQLFKTKAFNGSVGTQIIVNSNTNDTYIVKQSTSGDVVTTKVYIFASGTTVPSPDSIPSTLAPSQQVVFNKSTQGVISVSGTSLPSPDTIFDILHPKTQLSTKGALYGNFGFTLGSALGNIFANGNQVDGIVYSTLLGQIGKGLAIAVDGIQGDLSSFIHGTNVNVLDNFAGGLGAGLLSSSVGTISSTLTLDLANQLGIKGFGVELISTVVSADASAVVVQVLNNIHNGISAFGAGFTTDAFIDASGNVVYIAKNASIAEHAAVGDDMGLPTTNFYNVALNAVASYLGSKLAS